jgi:hypothetical protein
MAKHAICKAKRARFVLDNWEKFSPFLEPHCREADGPLAAKLRGMEQAAMVTGDYSVEKALAPVRGQPDCIVRGSMREYQIEGLKWLVKQHDMCAGGVLGDEMGLGKTLQIISFFGFLKTVRAEDGPHLVVAPLSVMNSWAEELAKWCPCLKVCPHFLSLLLLLFQAMFDATLRACCARLSVEHSKVEVTC